MCLIVGCSRKSGRDKGIRLYQVPAVVTNQGPEVEEGNENKIKPKKLEQRGQRKGENDRRNFKNRNVY